MRKVDIDPRLFHNNKLSIDQILILSIIEQFSFASQDFNLSTRDIKVLLGNKKGVRAIQDDLKKLDDMGIITRKLKGTYDYSGKYQKNFVNKRIITINYKNLEELLGNYEFEKTQIAGW